MGTFPNSPSVNDTTIIGSKTFKWTGYAWTQEVSTSSGGASATGASYVYTSGSNLANASSNGEFKHSSNNDTISINQSDSDGTSFADALNGTLTTTGRIGIIFGDSTVERNFYYDSVTLFSGSYTFTATGILPNISTGSGKTVTLNVYPDAPAQSASEYFGFPDGTHAESIVTSFNGQTGAVTGVSSVNGQTGAVTVTGAELSSSLTISDPVGPDQTSNQVYNQGTSLEVIIRDMLISYQVPDVTNISSPNPSIIEHNATISFTTVDFTKSNNSNIDTSVDGHVIYIDPHAANVDVSFTHAAATSQTVNVTVSDTAQIVTSNAGASGTAKSSTGHKLQVTGQDSQGSSFERTESWSVYFRSYFGASATTYTSSNGDDIILEMTNSILDADSKRTIVADSTSADTSKYTYLITPTCHYEAISSIVQNGATQVYGAFTSAGEQVVNDIKYTFFKSNTPGAFASGDSLVVS
tara:strand:+ start:1415 stop:2818 length:1404 start_codon:yes stop_codon:yes gene_type:complete